MGKHGMGKVCSAEQLLMPLHQNMALLDSGGSSLLPGASTSLQGGSPCSHGAYCPRRPPRTRRSTDFCPPGRLSSRSHANPHPKSHRGEVSEAESSRTWCQPQSTKGQRSPVASNGRRVGRWNPEARGCKKTKISAYEGVFLPSLAPPEACTLQKEPTKTLNFCNKKISL